MSNQSQILTALKTAVSTSLGSDYTELKYSYDLELNDLRDQKKGYGIGALAAARTESGPMKSLNYAQGFFVVLTETFVNRSSDCKEREVLATLYDKFEALTEVIFLKKLSIPTVVRVVSDVSLDDPTNPSKGVVSLRGVFIIEHKKTIT